MSEEMGMSVTREKDFSQWYLDVVRKGGFVDQRSPVKGFDVITPWGYGVWEILQKHLDGLFKKHGVQNAYFPLFIPESLIKKEEDHFEDFKAEAFGVTEGGGDPLEEKLYVRPTSETVMYNLYSLWIRSHKDLPLVINQWNNVVRYDTKGTKPLIRPREFLWQEGHTAHADKEGADKQIEQAVSMYKESMELQALAPLILVRPKSDTFAGADYSVVFDTIVQDGKVVQGPGSHMLGQNFSKPFDIKFQDEKEEEKYVWQTSWGMSVRQLGIIIMHHGDDKGAVLPPKVAPIQCVIIPILFKGKEKEVLKACESVKKKLEKKVRVHLDGRDYTPGFKFNEWELKGVPLRIEIGPKDLKKKEVTIVRRIDGKEEKLKQSEIDTIRLILDDIQEEMEEQSEKKLKENITEVTSMDDLKGVKGFACANWCGEGKCEENIKAESGGYEIRGSLYKKKEKIFGPCLYCRKKAEMVVYIARAY